MSAAVIKNAAVSETQAVVPPQAKQAQRGTAAKADSSDQADDLRRIVEEKRRSIRRKGRIRTIAVLSGKGGVGKSNIALALSCAIADTGKRVLLLDADLGMANLDILCGISAKFNLSHLVDGSRTLSEVLTPLEERLNVLPGGVGLREMADLDAESLERVYDTLVGLEDKADVVVLDTGAGIHRGVISFASAADITLLVTTPEPTSVRDAYGVIKSLGQDGQNSADEKLFLAINMVTGEGEAIDVAERIRTASKQFLGREPSYLGYVLRDMNVERAVRRRKIFYRATPSSPAALCIKKLASGLIEIMDGPAVPAKAKGLKAFFLKLTRGFK